MNDILKRLGLESTNPGTWSGARSSASEEAPLIESVNPATGEVIAAVRATTRETAHAAGAQLSSLARAFGISERAARHVVQRTTWRHVD